MLVQDVPVMVIMMPRSPVVMAVHGVPVFRRIGNGLHFRQGRAGAE